MVHTMIRRVAASLIGGLALFTSSALIIGVPAAHAVVPPSESSRLALTEPVAAEQDPSEAPAAGEDPVVADLSLEEFARELGAEGLLFSTDGNAILSESAGLGTPPQLVLAQTAADRFGIQKNPFFDPARVAVVRDGRAIADLSTGVILGHPIGSALFGTTEVIPVDLLEELRARAGWSIAEARKAQAARYAKLLGGYVPVAFQSDEAYAAYLEAARANYSALAAAA